MLPVVKAAKEAKVQRIVITHPEFPTTLPDHRPPARAGRTGVYFERCFTTPNTGKVSLGAGYANIRQVGPESTILATDLGQSTAPYPDEGLATYMGKPARQRLQRARGPAHGARQPGPAARRQNGGGNSRMSMLKPCVIREITPP